MSEDEYNFKDHLDELQPGHLYEVIIKFDIPTEKQTKDMVYMRKVPGTNLLELREYGYERIYGVNPDDIISIYEIGVETLQKKALRASKIQKNRLMSVDRNTLTEVELESVAAFMDDLAFYEEADNFRLIEEQKRLIDEQKTRKGGGKTKTKRTKEQKNKRTKNKRRSSRRR
jgi:hypothetical protein